MKAPRQGRRDNLPATLTSFIGRRRELAALSDLLACNRLLTLTGPAGAGKTRLAIETARRTAARYPDGVWLVDLAGLTDARLIPQAVADLLGFTESEGGFSETLQRHLADWQTLLLVDNCEHLVDGCAEFLAGVLRTCPTLSVLATSREPLRIHGEQVWPVESLALPTADSSLYRATHSEAVQLFLNRARLAWPAFEATPENIGAVCQVCTRLDGLPLASELAAARLGQLSIEAILRELGDRFRLLVDGKRDSPARHHSLRKSIDWSYDRLSRPEQRLFNRLAVFHGGFDKTAAQAVAGGIDSAAGVDGLISGLIDKSLLVAERVDGTARYRLLESVRAYAAERLARSPQSERVHRLHAEYYRSLVEPGTLPRGPHEAGGSWVARVALDVDNLRAAIDWSHGKAADLEMALTLGFADFCQHRGFFSEGRYRLAAVLTDRTAASDRLAVLKRAALLAWRQGDARAALELADRSVSVARSHHDQRLLAEALNTLGFVLLGSGKLEAARPPLEEQLALASVLQDPALEASAEHTLGLLDSHTGPLDRSRGHLERALSLLGGLDGIAGSDYNTLLRPLGWVLLQLGDLDQARTMIRLSLRQLQDGDRFHLAASLDACAELLAVEGARERAMRLLGASDRIRDEVGAAPPSMAVLSRERWVAAARHSLGPVAEQSFQAGRRMTPQEAKSYALAPSSATRHNAAAEGLALTARQRQIGELMGAGLTNRQIASRLALSPRTVDAHVEHLRNKLGVRSRVEIVRSIGAAQ